MLVRYTGSCQEAVMSPEQALLPNKPRPAGLGGDGIVLASDASVALLSGSPATASTAAGAYLFSFYASSNQYNACPQEIKVLTPDLACETGNFQFLLMLLLLHVSSPKD